MLDATSNVPKYSAEDVCISAFNAGLNPDLVRDIRTVLTEDCIDNDVVSDATLWTEALDDGDGGYVTSIDDDRAGYLADVLDNELKEILALLPGESERFEVDGDGFNVVSDERLKKMLDGVQRAKAFVKFCNDVAQSIGDDDGSLFVNNMILAKTYCDLDLGSDPNIYESAVECLSGFGIKLRPDIAFEAIGKNVLPAVKRVVASAETSDFDCS